MNPLLPIPPLRVVLVDDHPLVTEVLSQVLVDSGEFEVLAVLRDGESVIPYLETKPVDILLLDLRLPGMSGLEVLRIVRDRFPKTKVVICSGIGSDFSIGAAYSAGVHTFIEKNVDMAEFLATLRDVARGRDPLPGRTAEVLRMLVRQNRVMKPLGAKDVEILRRLASNQSPKEIAAGLGMSQSAIYKARDRVAERTGAKNAIDFYRVASDCGLIGS
jgi:DNA-binding NarL/FixJ family response regulator